jgi:hypothetical protein
VVASRGGDSPKSEAEQTRAEVQSAPPPAGGRSRNRSGTQPGADPGTLRRS